VPDIDEIVEFEELVTAEGLSSQTVQAVRASLTLSDVHWFLLLSRGLDCPTWPSVLERRAILIRK
jgi:hypothetical protein